MCEDLPKDRAQQAVFTNALAETFGVTMEGQQLVALIFWGIDRVAHKIANYEPVVLEPTQALLEHSQRREDVDGGIMAGTKVELA